MVTYKTMTCRLVGVAIGQQDVREGPLHDATGKELHAEAVARHALLEGAHVQIGVERIGDRHGEGRVRSGVLETDDVFNIWRIWEQS